MRWNLTRWYVGLAFIPLVLFSLCFWGVVQWQSSRTVEAVTAVATESSRPLNKEDKAPADWTGDGKADGWLYGEWLPGQESTVYLMDGNQVSPPFGLGEYLVAGFFIFISLAAIMGLAILMLDPSSFRRRAYQQAELDWREAVQTGRGYWDASDGIPLWAH